MYNETYLNYYKVCKKDGLKHLGIFHDTKERGQTQIFKGDGSKESSKTQ